MHEDPAKDGEARRVEKLLVLEGSNAGDVYVIEQTPLILGRTSDVDIQFDDRAVTRRHARVFRAGADVMIEDLGSDNGVWINGRRMERAPLFPGDRVQIGRVILEFRRETADERDTLELEPNDARVSLASLVRAGRMYMGSDEPHHAVRAFGAALDRVRCGAEIAPLELAALLVDLAEAHLASGQSARSASLAEECLASLGTQLGEADARARASFLLAQIDGQAAGQQRARDALRLVSRGSSLHGRIQRWLIENE